MKKKIRIILAVIACIIVALVGYSAYEVHQSAQEFQKAYESKKSFERTETDEAEADGEKKTEEQSGERPYGVLEPGSEYEVDTYIDNRDNFQIDCIFMMRQKRLWIRCWTDFFLMFRKSIILIEIIFTHIWMITMKIIYRKCENDKISRADALLIFYRNLTRIHCEICQISL